jgi:hypothetical protein
MNRSIVDYFLCILNAIPILILHLHFSKEHRVLVN